MPDLVSSIHQRYSLVQEHIAAAAGKAGRKPDLIRLVVVTKKQPVSVILAAMEAGVKIFGENFAEETLEKLLALESQSTGSQYAVEWHMIGHVQSRKADLVAKHFALFHSLDSLKLARRVDHFAGEFGRTLPVLLEVNVGGEETKHGWLAREEAHWPELLADAGAISALPNLKLRGLMTMPPLSTDPELARPYFRHLRALRDRLSQHLPQTEWGELSMGTSSDYAVAVEEGATLVRVGQAILGPRT